MQFSDNGIGYDDMCRVASAIATNTSLRNCVFGGQSATANNVSVHARRVINDVLSKNKTTKGPKGGSPTHDVDDGMAGSFDETPTQSPVQYVNGRPTLDPTAEDFVPGMLRRITFDFKVAPQ